MLSIPHCAGGQSAVTRIEGPEEIHQETPYSVGQHQPAGKRAAAPGTPSDPQPHRNDDEKLKQELIQAQIVAYAVRESNPQEKRGVKAGVVVNQGATQSPENPTETKGEPGAVQVGNEGFFVDLGEQGAENKRTDVAPHGTVPAAPNFQ